MMITFTFILIFLLVVSAISLGGYLVFGTAAGRAAVKAVFFSVCVIAFALASIVASMFLLLALI